MHIEVETRIDKPAAEVWNYIATNHVQNHPKWDPAIKSFEQKTPGPLGVGSKAEMVRKDSGPPMTMDVDFTEWDPDRKLAFNATSRQMEMNAFMQLDPVDPTATELTVSVDVAGKGLARAMMPLMGGRMKKQIAASLDRIKRSVESV